MDLYVDRLLCRLFFLSVHSFFALSVAYSPRLFDNLCWWIMLVSGAKWFSDKNTTVHWKPETLAFRTDQEVLLKAFCSLLFVRSFIRRIVCFEKKVLFFSLWNTEMWSSQMTLFKYLQTQWNVYDCVNIQISKFVNRYLSKHKTPGIIKFVRLLTFQSLLKWYQHRMSPQHRKLVDSSYWLKNWAVLNA